MNAITAAHSTSADHPDDHDGHRVNALQNVDYAAATTQLSTEELALQAAQESYASIAKLVPVPILTVIRDADGM